MRFRQAFSLCAVASNGCGRGGLRAVRHCNSRGHQPYIFPRIFAENISAPSALNSKMTTGGVCALPG